MMDDLQPKPSLAAYWLMMATLVGGAIIFFVWLGIKAGERGWMF